MIPLLQLGLGGPNLNVGDTIMSARKSCGSILSSLILIAALSLPSTNPSQHSQELLGNPAQTQRVDGGGPVPPIPPSANRLTADGGGPVPPIPPTIAASAASLIRQSPLLADGGGPVPPIPPTPSLRTLTTDGGGPVPPIPPACLSAGFLPV
jgi:hypothetical protein